MLKSQTWSPWVSGSVFAFLFLFCMFFFDSPAGSLKAYSSLYDYISGMINGIYPDTIDWEVVFVIGIFLGALIAAVLGKNFKFQPFPEDHKSKGPAFNVLVGPILMFLGGFFVMGGLIIAGNSFLKLWCDSLGLCMIVGLFILIMFIEAVIIGTLASLKIEDQKEI